MTLLDAPTAEDWSDQDLDLLFARAWTSLDEALICYKAGAPHAALASVAGAFEGILLAAVVSHPDELAAAGRSQRQPSKHHLSDLARLALTMGWLREPIAGQVQAIINTVRTVSAHPGAYVRWMRQMDEGFDLADPAGFQAVYEIVQRACQQLTETTAPAPAAAAAAPALEPGSEDR